MHLQDEAGAKQEEDPAADKDAGQPTAGLGEWQFSLRSLFVLVTAWAAFLGVVTPIAGLEGLPVIVGIIAILGAGAFGVGCLAGWIAAKTDRDPGDRAANRRRGRRPAGAFRRRRAARALQSSGGLPAGLRRRGRPR
jgi:hypothetical protein